MARSPAETENTAPCRIPDSAGIRVPDILLCLGVPALVVIVSLYSKSFWGDEILSLEFSARSLGELAGSLAADYHPPLYFLLLKGWITLIGETEPALRAFQGVQGAILLLVSLFLFRTMLPGRRYHPSWILLFASAELWLFMPMLRYYTLAAVLVVCASLAFLRWVEKGGRRSGALLILSYTLILYTDYPASVTILIHGLYVFIRKRHLTGRFALAALVTLALFSPWIAITAGQVGSLLAAEALADLNISPAVIPLKIGYALYAFLLGETTYPFEPVAIALLLLCGAAVGIVRPGKEWWRSDVVLLAAGAVVLGTVFTSLITTFISRHTSFIYTPSRTLFALPFFFLLVGAFSSQIRSRVLSISLFTALLAANAHGIVNWTANRHFLNPVYATPWKEVLDDLRGQRGTILVDESLCYEYYRRWRSGEYPELLRASSVAELTAAAEHAGTTGVPQKLFLILIGRESTESELPAEIIDHIRSTGKLLWERKYLWLDEGYRTARAIFLRRDAYDAKLTLSAYDMPAANR